LHISPCSVDTLAPLLGSAAVISVNDSKELDKEAIRCGIEINAELFDISLAAYVLSPGDSAPSLTHIASAFGNFTIPESDGTPLPEYCAEALYELVPALQKQLADSDQEQIYYKIELPLARVLAQMERSGFKVDIPGLREYGDELLEAQKNAESEIYTLAGGEFNIASPKQLGTVLFEKLGLPALKKTKSGYSTSADVLEKLRPYSPIIDLIFDYRRAAKLHSTYAVGLVNAADTDGIIHSSFKQNVTATGRLSSAEPNLQNIPIRTELGRRFRRYFIPRRESSVLIDADYSQIELRILAHMSGDTAMTEAFLSGEDIHTVTASQVFGVPLDAVTPELRKRAKAVNFGIVYGIGDFSLAADIGVTKREAKAYIESYLEKYSGIREFMSGAKEQARREGYVMTLYGRRRYIPEISSPRVPLRAFGERVAMNSPIQGTAADIIKIAMINTSRALRKAGLDARLILQVHDELIVECAERDKEQAAKILRDCMENAAKLTVPLTVDLHWGRSWEECK
jgi:DNA-directed DNA polymerase